MLYLTLPLAYLLGSLPMAILVARVLGLPDPRTTGSRNPGATNVLRYGGKAAAALTLAGDVLKAVIPVGLARGLDADPLIVAGCGLLAFLGHLYPVFFGFKGGKGVATALGVWLVIAPAVAGLLIATWVVVAAVFRYSSLSALVAALAAPLYVWWLAPIDAYVLLSLLMSALLVWRHRTNIQKLATGQESRIGASRSG
ncbi:glycerol-3-phosphate acyltransferase [Sulfurifustis variabilis]|uniref:Glycerol-3-phosphate acyltransferase n=1 Tax=Sulfurifustis variabilis TaxID=1675686 RepID=A0A1B4V0M2_9GAMM|nr:glycerol-3-phosphate 1-O-acyltransferase PlsY [Sulfurifustis variabilis]BAU46745.1 glycerol-3-phosphate acyltransferase [Sulfurifustis variabilis]